MSEILYHGSISPVEKIDLTRANPKRDFGVGFYVTTSLEQAVSFSRIAAKRHALSQGVVSTYAYEQSVDLRILHFDKADLQWLDFVLTCRGFASTSKVGKEEDLLIGPVANDQVGQTLNLLMTGAYGDPHSDDAKNFALSLLLTERLVDQWVFKTDFAIKCLSFMEAHEYEI
jgi:hypothetical protein